MPAAKATQLGWSLVLHNAFSLAFRIKTVAAYESEGWPQMCRYKLASDESKRTILETI